MQILGTRSENGELTEMMRSPLVQASRVSSHLLPHPGPLWDLRAGWRARRGSEVRCSRAAARVQTKRQRLGARTRRWRRGPRRWADRSGRGGGARGVEPPRRLLQAARARPAPRRRVTLSPARSRRAGRREAAAARLLLLQWGRWRRLAATEAAASGERGERARRGPSPLPRPLLTFPLPPRRALSCPPGLGSGAGPASERGTESRAPPPLEGFRGAPGGWPWRPGVSGVLPRSRKSRRPCQRRARPSLPPPASRWSLDSLPLRRPRRRSLPGVPLCSPRPWGGGPPGGAEARRDLLPRRPPEHCPGPWQRCPRTGMEGTLAVASAAS